MIDVNRVAPSTRLYNVVIELISNDEERITTLWVSRERLLYFSQKKDFVSKLTNLVLFFTCCCLNWTHRIQYQYPELQGQRVIQVEGDSELSTTGNCYRVTRVGQISEDDSFTWIIRVRVSQTQEAVYEGRCIPTKDQVYVRPATIIDLILTPKTQLPL